MASPSASHPMEPCQTVDPLWNLAKTEALRLCRVYEEEMGIMYPVLELSELLDQVHLLYGPMDRTIGQGLHSSGQNGLDLWWGVLLWQEAKLRRDHDADLNLQSIFYFQMHEETLAWRTIGIVERMYLEKGLHRQETLDQPAIVAEGKDRVLRLFWSIYVLDRRWSFGTGMPFALEDTDIDPWLPEPAEKTPYLRVMIRYSRIAAKVWKFISA
ncbi:hypothetical protein NUU61_001642 [Penicillium alfredii]|uniref:Xylanolytic transcriptional activator regulatory domain-containing protein n=1 Tax=Penicillium alfredii TaxID=1506179 RepID=A0A9W9KF93_9EURO|nr:uncharacterized protein NUU61_001642 [Penicillium alfredii]KAJ5104295.1 hypothetical protein NUU61_001642 [Penicillium alfredii]